MSNIDEKYYIGFEGEPEITFSIIKENNIKRQFGMWSGYFDNIMKQIKPKEGRWTALAYYYQLGIGWYDESPWLIQNLEESYEQLMEIEVAKLENEEKEIIKIILSMLKDAIDNNCEAFILYD
ncbi:hypothetical protein [Clostridium lundense]|uniref:hypothetical protein n=1 Tax=Clostridium lundense TaxID=319475 RepID=UPI000A830DC7|nr:hypothetical protein [Clostridium lundense]